MKPKMKNKSNLQIFVKWIVLILLALLLVAYILGQLSWT
jgi:hypothetical protein